MGINHEIGRLEKMGQIEEINKKLENVELLLKSITLPGFRGAFQARRDYFAGCREAAIILITPV